jgi:3-phenylpropionate/trans-cinnamate dioxygenase ferredoxin component
MRGGPPPGNSVVTPGMSWHSVCPITSLVDEMPLAAEVSGVAVCVVRIAGEVFAAHDECTHQSVPLSEGDVEDGTIECWRHGSRFDLRSGPVINPPATEPVRVYRTRVAGGKVRVDIGG